MKYVVFVVGNNFPQTRCGEMLPCFARKLWLDPRPVTSRTPGGAKSFLRGAHIFWEMSNCLKLFPSHFYRGGEKICRGAKPSCAPPPGYGPVGPSSNRACLPDCYRNCRRLFWASSFLLTRRQMRTVSWSLPLCSCCLLFTFAFWFKCKKAYI